MPKSFGQVVRRTKRLKEEEQAQSSIDYPCGIAVKLYNHKRMNCIQHEPEYHVVPGVRLWMSSINPEDHEYIILSDEEVEKLKEEWK
jgi:hypothetical protein